MPIGAGKYDHLATHVRTETEASAVAVLVFRGNEGSGFSAQGSEDFMRHVPDILRRMADEIEREFKAATN